MNQCPGRNLRGSLGFNQQFKGVVQYQAEIDLSAIFGPDMLMTYIFMYVPYVGLMQVKSKVAPMFWKV